MTIDHASPPGPCVWVLVVRAYQSLGHGLIMTSSRHQPIPSPTSVDLPRLVGLVEMPARYPVTAIVPETSRHDIFSRYTKVCLFPPHVALKTGTSAKRELRPSPLKRPLTSCSFPIEQRAAKSVLIASAPCGTA